MKHVTVKQALQNAADNPKQLSDEIIQFPVSELIARNLFEIANSPDADVRGSMAKANRARSMIMDRLAGKRKAGTHPATRAELPVEFIDLTTPEEEPS